MTQVINSRPKEYLEMNEKIHSGQFMVSEYDKDSDNEEVQKNSIKGKGYNFDSSLSTKHFQFINGSQCESKLKIDESLNTMFQYLSIAVCGKISNPKWNSFKGVKFQPKDKIRLNNIIWREYHMQFVKKIKPVVVQFASPVPDIIHINGNVVLEGQYWNKRINIIAHQYKKWREFSKNRLTTEYNKEGALIDSILVQRSLYHKIYSNSHPPNFNDFFMDLNECNLPIYDITGDQHNSQIIQPQLTNLQPRMESSINFLNDYFCASHKTIKSQKGFSSENSLNIKPPIIDHMKNSNFPYPIKRNFNTGVHISSTRLSSIIDYDLSSYRRKHRKSSRKTSHYPHKILHSENKNNSTDIGFCKTPNLLSILLQPISSETSLIHNEQISTKTSSISSVTSRQSLVISATKGVNHHNGLQRSNNVPMSRDNFELTQNKDIDAYKAYGNNLSAQSLDCAASLQNASFSQSVRMKQSITASNVVQQYLDELSSLLMKSQDYNKISKAALLYKASEYIKKMRIEKDTLQSEILNLQNEIDSLQNKFSAFCSQLPATGVCVSNNKCFEGKIWFEDFVIKHSVTNWKFYVFSMMFESLFTGYNNSVSTLSMETLAHNVAAWLEKECALMKLRLIVMNGMRTLSTRTSIVNNPKKLEDEIKYLVKTKSISESCGEPSSWCSCNADTLQEEKTLDKTKVIRYKCSSSKLRPRIIQANVRTCKFLDRQDI